MEYQSIETKLTFSSSRRTIFTLQFEREFDLMADCQIVDSLYSNKIIWTGSGYEILSDLLQAVHETLEAKREVDNNVVGKIAHRYVQSNWVHFKLSANMVSLEHD